MSKEVEKITFNRKEAASYLGLAENTFIKLLKDGSVPHIRVGRRVLIPKSAIDRFINNF